jgi:hypothetical protein
MVHQIEKEFIKQFWFLGKYRKRVERYGFKYSIATIVILVGLHVVGRATSEPLFHWAAYIFLGFLVLTWIYMYIEQRVMRTSYGRDDWR